MPLGMGLLPLLSSQPPLRAGQVVARVAGYEVPDLLAEDDLGRAQAGSWSGEFLCARSARAKASESRVPPGP